MAKSTNSPKKSKPRKKRRKSVSKTEMKLRRKKYKINSQIKDDIYLYQKYSDKKKFHPDIKYLFEGKERVAKSIRDLIANRIRENNENKEEINRAITRRFKRKFKSNGVAYNERPKSSKKKQIETIAYFAWERKNVIELVFDGTINSFNNIDINTDADSVEYAIDSIFLRLNKYDVFLLIIEKVDLNATYEIIKDGYHEYADKNDY